jgi:4-hydroxybenzoate polyprenyltransferase/geranylgeranylglycerol-phosphate geranylgeranyltransferase
VLTTLLGVGYSKVFKSMALLGNLDRGVLGACAVVFGGLAATGRVSFATVLLAAGTIAHDGATNLVGAIRDVDGDRAANCSTVPVIYGVSRAVEIASALASLSLMFALASLWRMRPGRVALVLFVGGAALDIGVYRQLLVRGAHVTRAQALAAHKLLVLERNLLSSAFLAARAPKLALSLVSITAPVSLVLQALMRDRHERSSADAS